MSNWALDLQWYDLVRVWSTGEANILGDAPSWAPWETELAQHLPIPDRPVRELAHQMYQALGEFELLVRDRARETLDDEPQWKTLRRSEWSGAVLEPLAPEGPNSWDKLPERPEGASPCDWSAWGAEASPSWGYGPFGWRFGATSQARAC